MSNPNIGQPTQHFGAFPQQPAISPAEALEMRNKRQLPSDIVRVPSGVGRQNALTGGNPLGIPSIPEQARGLKHDVDLIYQYVHNNVTFIPTNGLHKGGLGALVDGSGNAFDQCDLMIKLLTDQSAYAAQYVIGNILLNAAEWSSWLGVDQSNLAGAVQLLANGGIACTGFPATNQLLLDHCWVKVTINGTDYYFDPAMKTHTVTTGINLANAIGYPPSSPTFLDQAKAGAVIDPNGNSVRNINYANINSNLTTYSTNLINWIKQNNPGASLDDILGGRSIVPTSGTIRNTTLPYANSIYSVSSSVPNAYKAYFRFQYDAIPNTSPTQYNVDVAFYTVIRQNL